MSCLPCFTPHDVKWVTKRLENHKKEKQRQPENEEQEEEKHREVNNNLEALSFTFRELATATKNFRRESLIGEGGFGRVYKGRLAKDGPEVAVKQLDRNGAQGHKEFLVEVLILSLLHDDNLVNLIGFCADGEQRLLVYEYMPLGSLEDHLLDLEPGKRALDWHERMKIALGAAKGLQYLHDKANPPVIYRDLKPSNILLDRDYNAKLSDFGLASLGIGGDNIYASSRIMGTFGYCAPEYQKTGELTIKSDVYSFGVVLLELITGRRAVDTTKKGKEQTLVAWAQPIFKEVNRFPEVADPLLQGNFPTVDLQQAIAIAAMCVNEEPGVRPLMSDVVNALTFIGESAQGFSHPPTPASSTEDDEDHKARERELALAEALAWAGANSDHP